VRVVLKTWHRAGLLALFAGIAIALLAWLCLRDPGINFLSRDRRAEWVLFPAAVDASAHRVASADTVFRREFVLENTPRLGRLNVRAAKRAELRINGVPVDIGASRNWKDVSCVNVLAFLQRGTNFIEARVFNDNAPPALWLTLSTDQLRLRSDETWQASLAGSALRPARLASTPQFPHAGNRLAWGERTISALANIWPSWIIFGAIALIICEVARRWLRRWQTSAQRLPRGHVIALLLIIAGSWLLLFWNNAELLPYKHGFDAQPHLNYIKYVQERRALPLPTEGFEMFQPPLYYVLSAITLSSCGLSASDESAVVVLRVLTMLFGIAHFTLVYLCLRLFFPSRIDLQLIGLALAAFLPMQLYLGHYVTNETLAATLVTASLYFGLRLLRTENPSVWQYVWLGLCAGAALLAKTTGILLLPPLLLALASKLATPQSPLATRLRNLGVMLATCFAVCGWQYIRIWYHFGTPFLGNWDAASGFSWWQDPGYRVAGDYLRCGRSLIAPLFSSLNGFIDGIYSTLWGDGLCGGVSDPAYGPPWNYDLMVGGYWLALAPTLMILTGAAVQVIRFVRKPSPEWFTLLGLSAMVTLGLIFMTLKVPSYAQVKAFYGLSMLVPLCFFGAIGWDVMTRGRALLQLALAAVVVVWAINSFASVWIRHSASQHVYAGIGLQLDRKIDLAVSEAVKAVDSDPSSPIARPFLASVLDEAGRTNEAMQEAQRAIELSPLDTNSHLEAGILRAKQGQTGRAIEEARRAIELGPENVSAYDLLLACLFESSHKDEAIAVARNALTVSPFSAQLHYGLGIAVAQEGDFVQATNQLGYALLFRPDWAEPYSKLRLALLSLEGDPDGPKHLKEASASAPDSPALLDALAWLLATHLNADLRNGQEAVRLAEHGCVITGRKNPALLVTLSAAYAETGRFTDAIKTGEEALSLARSSGDSALATRSENLLDSFRANRPYREGSGL
jgi:Flp pilus assembly protein TadD